MMRRYPALFTPDLGYRLRSLSAGDAHRESPEPSRPYLAFPDCKHPPPQLPERRSDPSVASHVGGELGFPEGRIGARLRCARAALVSVPEATMHEYDRPVLSKHNVRSAGEGPDILPEPEPLAVKEGPHESFWLGLRPPN